MEEQTEENTIPLQEGVEYYATIRVVSTKDSNQLRITTSRGPTEFYENAPDDAFIEVPISWQFVERLTAEFSQHEEEPSNVINLFPQSTTTETLN